MLILFYFYFDEAHLEAHKVIYLFKESNNLGSEQALKQIPNIYGLLYILQNLFKPLLFLTIVLKFWGF